MKNKTAKYKVLSIMLGAVLLNLLIPSIGGMSWLEVNHLLLETILGAENAPSMLIMSLVQALFGLLVLPVFVVLAIFVTRYIESLRERA